MKSITKRKTWNHTERTILSWYLRTIS